MEYRLQRLQRKDKQRGTPSTFYVPTRVARLIGEDALFRCELTDEGVLFRYEKGQNPHDPLPGWVTEPER